MEIETERVPMGLADVDLAQDENGRLLIRHAEMSNYYYPTPTGHVDHSPFVGSQNYFNYQWGQWKYLRTILVIASEANSSFGDNYRKHLSGLRVGDIVAVPTNAKLCEVLYECGFLVADGRDVSEKEYPEYYAFSKLFRSDPAGRLPNTRNVVNGFVSYSYAIKVRS